MNELAAELGSALCRHLDALGPGRLPLCTDGSAASTLGYLFLLAIGVALAALFAKDRLAVSDPVRNAIEERIASRAPTPTRDPPA